MVCVASIQTTDTDATATAARSGITPDTSLGSLEPPLAVAALAANKHLLVQKPLAASPEDAQAIAAAAAQAKLRGVISGLYMSYFDQPLMHDLKAKYEAGYFGDITHLYARLMHRGGLTLSKVKG